MVHAEGTCKKAEAQRINRMHCILSNRRSIIRVSILPNISILSIVFLLSRQKQVIYNSVLRAYCTALNKGQVIAYSTLCYRSTAVHTHTTFDYTATDNVRCWLQLLNSCWACARGRHVISVLRLVGATPIDLDLGQVNTKQTCLSRVEEIRAVSPFCVS